MKGTSKAAYAKLETDEEKYDFALRRLRKEAALATWGLYGYREFRNIASALDSFIAHYDRMTSEKFS